MSPVISYPSRLLMQNLYNIRDIGGYATRDGQTTAFGRFLRSDAPLMLDENEKQQLAAYSLSAVFDLRSPNEINSRPYALHPAGNQAYYNVPLLGEDIDLGIAQVKPRKSPEESDLADLYIHMLEHAKPQMRQLFEQIARTPPGAVLLHCTHGKDRTGLVAALLLMLAGVGDSDIIANYQISYTYLKPLFVTMSDLIPAHILPYLNSDADNMEQTLQFFHQHYQSAEDYLYSCQVGRDTCQEIYHRLVTDPYPAGS